MKLDLATLESEGFLVIERFLEPDECNRLRGLAETALGSQPTAGDRNILRETWVREVAQHSEIRIWVEAAIGADGVPIRAILFDKSPGANWNLGYHQDRGVSFAERVEAPGFVGWSVKDGVPHAIAPAVLLERMVTIRLSLDACSRDNGPLRVLPGTHRRGVIPKSEISAIREGIEEMSCTTEEGGVVIMRPLLLHASSAATVPSHRRVLHLEFGPSDPGHGLRYYDWGSR
ncbi:MAG: phytanoyl-CoA dioxygenase family protein [Fimbriimonadaceae bacterium]|nr:phytanoyl-CoA dioxygenase family protein [Fimbriimonadaceae bacterium]